MTHKQGGGEVEGLLSAKFDEEIKWKQTCTIYNKLFFVLVHLKIKTYLANIF